MLTQFDNLKISDAELSKLIARFGEAGTRDWLEELSDAIAVHGYKYKSHYRAVLMWDRRERKRHQSPSPAVQALPDPEYLERRINAIHTMFKRDFSYGLRSDIPGIEEIRLMLLES